VLAVVRVRGEARFEPETSVDQEFEEFRMHLADHAGVGRAGGSH
jgi:hypothetical protein